MTDKAQRKATKAVLKITERALWNALMLAKAGVHVFPVRLDDPHPKPEGGVKATKVYYPFAWSEVATADAEEVVDLFERWPGSAVGIATGPSGLIAVDLDNDPKRDGRTSLDMAVLDLPETHNYPSLGGGEHHIYKAPKKRPAKTLSDLPIADPEGNVVKLYGVDIRATGGMLVYYGPQLEEPPKFAKAPEWAIVEVANAGPKAEPSLAMQEWLDSLITGKRPLKVREAVEAVTSKGMGHADLLVATNRLAELGSSGAADVAAAVAEARERYVAGWPKYGKAWDDAMLDAAQYYGKPLPVVAIVDMPLVGPTAAREPKKGKGKHKGKDAKKAREAASGGVLDVPERPHSTPDDFFEKATGLQSTRLGTMVNWDGSIGAGIDGTAWHYEHGVWVVDDDIIARRAIELLGNRYRREHTGVARDIVLKGHDVPILKGDPHPDYINVANGMLDWRRGALVPHHPDYLSSVQLPVSYTPGARHPRFTRWLGEVASDSLQIVLWELIAYSMLNDNPFQKAAMLMGPGGTGKGTLIRLIEHMAGTANTVHLTPAEMAGTFEPARLFGKLLNTVGDLDGKYLPDTGPFKRITGGDSIMAQHKNKNPFEFAPWAFPLFAANNIAVSSDVTSGFFRRWLILPFTHVVDRSKPFDERKLWAERDAIFTTAAALLPDLVEQNDFTAVAEVIMSKEDFETQSDIVRTWLMDDEHVELADPSIGSLKATRAHAYDTYASWCQRTGHPRPLSRIAFSKRLQAIGYKIVKVRGTMTLVGVKLDTAPLTQTFTTAGADDAEEA